MPWSGRHRLPVSWASSQPLPQEQTQVKKQAFVTGAGAGSPLWLGGGASHCMEAPHPTQVTAWVSGHLFRFLVYRTILVSVFPSSPFKQVADAAFSGLRRLWRGEKQKLLQELPFLGLYMKG